MGWYEFNKVQISTLYGVFKQARGSGMLRHLARRFGYDQLILQAIRIRLRYPLGCPDIDSYIKRLLHDREYSNKYYFTDLFDPAAVTFRNVKG